MRLPQSSLVLLTSAVLTISSFADSVFLINGTKLEGKIVSETETELTIETKAGGVVDQQTVKKADILGSSKAAADETAYAPLKTIKLGDSSLPTAQQYDTYLTPLKAFVAQFPTSSHKGEIEKLAADIEAEQKRVTDGEVKLDGKWLSKADVQRERYQVNGTLAFNFLKQQAARNDVVGALNTFALLEKQYPGSRGYIDAVDVVKRLLPPLKQQADARIARIPSEDSDREKAISNASGADKTSLQAEFDREKQTNEAAIAAAKRQNLKWPPFLTRSEDAMKQIANLAQDEASHLASIDTTKARQSLQLAEQARGLLDKKDLAAAEEKIRAARDAWRENEIADRLDKQLTEAKSAASASEPAAPVASTPPAEEPKKEEPKTETTSSESEPAAATPANTPEAAVEEESGGLSFKIVLGVVLAIVAFAGWTAYSKIRNKANEVIE